MSLPRLRARTSEQAAAASIQTEWTGTATVDHGNAGFISFKTSRVELTATGSARISVIRHGGFSGAVSVDIATAGTTGDIGMTSGVHFTAMSETVSYADGEAGEKYIDVTVGSSPGAGLHLFIIEMTNATGGVTIHHPLMHVYLDNGGVNTSATSITSATQSTLETTINAASAGDLIYMRDTSGVYSYNNRTTGQSYGGTFINFTGGTKTAPIVIAAYPGETPVIDQLYYGTDDGAGEDTTVGFYINAGDYLHFRGIEITKCLNSGILSSETAHIIGTVVEDCHIHHLGNVDTFYDGSNALYSSNVNGSDNIGGVRLDGAVDPIVRENSIHEMYYSKAASNNIDAVAAGLNSGVHGYDCRTPWVHNNDMHTLRSGVFDKRPHQTSGVGRHVHDNYFTLIELYAFEMGVAGGGSLGGHDFFYHHNVAILDATTGSDVCSCFPYYRGDVTEQPDGLHIYNNVQVGGKWLMAAETITGVTIHSNICRDLSNNIVMNADATYTYNNQLNYCDYNDWNNIGSIIFWLKPTQYTTLAAWRAAYPTDTQLDNDAGENSIDTAPTFVSEGAENYATTTGVTIGTGRFSRDMGIGTTMVGQS